MRKGKHIYLLDQKTITKDTRIKSLWIIDEGDPLTNLKLSVIKEVANWYFPWVLRQW